VPPRVDSDLKVVGQERGGQGATAIGRGLAKGRSDVRRSGAATHGHGADSGRSGALLARCSSGWKWQSLSRLGGLGAISVC
jgi:hypothetical protein